MPSDAVILIIDDEPQIRLAVRRALQDEAARVLEAGSAAEGEDLAAAERPDLIVLDLALPDATGLQVCRDIRAWSAAPIVVLSARHADADKVALLDAGADDYVTKPFSTAELKARVRAQLRRARLQQPRLDAPLETDGLRIDPACRVVSRGGATIHLTPTEWDLLRAFVLHAGRTLTHRQLFQAVWNRSGGDAQAYLRVHVANLRRKIETDPLRPRLIITEPGVGYRFECNG
jgi:two-component system, OmpR family, KDP operon response regulator KdpE